MTRFFIFAFAVIGAIILLLGGDTFAIGNLTESTEDNTRPPTNLPNNPIDPARPATWPTGDLFWNVCRAIAFAEGYNVPSSNPARLNNPGDISDGLASFSSEFHSGSNITHFPSPQTGWAWLYAKIRNAVNGTSNVYKPDMTWFEIGQKWAPPNWNVWATNVARYLGVDPATTLGEYFGK